MNTNKSVFKKSAVKVTGFLLAGMMVCMSFMANFNTYSLFSDSVMNDVTLNAATINDVVDSWGLDKTKNPTYIYLKKNKDLSVDPVIYFTISGDAANYILHINPVRLSENSIYYNQTDKQFQVDILKNVNVDQVVELLKKLDFNGKILGKLQIGYLNGYTSEPKDFEFSYTYLMGQLNNMPIPTPTVTPLPSPTPGSLQTLDLDLLNILKSIGITDDQIQALISMLPSLESTSPGSIDDIKNIIKAIGGGLVDQSQIAKMISDFIAKITSAQGSIDFGTLDLSNLLSIMNAMLNSAGNGSLPNVSYNLTGDISALDSKVTGTLGTNGLLTGNTNIAGSIGTGLSGNNSLSGSYSNTNALTGSINTAGSIANNIFTGATNIAGSANTSNLLTGDTKATGAIGSTGYLGDNKVSGSYSNTNAITGSVGTTGSVTNNFITGATNVAGSVNTSNLLTGNTNATGSIDSTGYLGNTNISGALTNQTIFGNTGVAGSVTNNAMTGDTKVTGSTTLGNTTLSGSVTNKGDVSVSLGNGENTTTVSTSVISNFVDSVEETVSTVTDGISSFISNIFSK